MESHGLKTSTNHLENFQGLLPVEALFAATLGCGLCQCDGDLCRLVHSLWLRIRGFSHCICPETQMEETLKHFLQQ